MYGNLYKLGYVNDSFGYEVVDVEGAFAVLFSGETEHYLQVCDIIKSECEKLGNNGFSREDFENVKKQMYGRLVRETASVTACAESAFAAELDGRGVYDGINIFRDITYEEAIAVSKEILNIDRCALSVVVPR